MEDTVTCNAYISYVHRNGMGNNGWNFDSAEIKFQRAKAYKSKSSRNKKNICSLNLLLLRAKILRSENARYRD